MARVTIEDCLKNVNNRFELVHLAAKRVRQVREGADLLVASSKTGMWSRCCGKLQPAGSRSRLTRIPDIYGQNAMIDTQNQPDYRRIPINKVGIKGLKYPVRVLDKSRGTQSTVADISMYVDLPTSARGPI